MGASAILQLINLILPGIANFILMIKGQDGSTSAVVYLDAADTQFVANQKQIQDWLAAHGKAPAAL